MGCVFSRREKREGSARPQGRSVQPQPYHHQQHQQQALGAVFDARRGRYGPTDFDSGEIAIPPPHKPHKVPTRSSTATHQSLFVCFFPSSPGSARRPAAAAETFGCATSALFASRQAEQSRPSTEFQKLQYAFQSARSIRHREVVVSGEAAAQVGHGTGCLQHRLLRPNEEFGLVPHRAVPTNIWIGESINQSISVLSPEQGDWWYRRQSPNVTPGQSWRPLFFHSHTGGLVAHGWIPLRQPSLLNLHSGCCQHIV